MPAVVQPDTKMKTGDGLLLRRESPLGQSISFCLSPFNQRFPMAHMPERMTVCQGCDDTADKNTTLIATTHLDIETFWNIFLQRSIRNLLDLRRELGIHRRQKQLAGGKKNLAFWGIFKVFFLFLKACQGFLALLFSKGGSSIERGPKYKKSNPVFFFFHNAPAVASFLLELSCFCRDFAVLFCFDLTKFWKVFFFWGSLSCFLKGFQAFCSKIKAL